MKSGQWKRLVELFALLCLGLPALCQGQDPKAGLPTFVVPDVGRKMKIIAYGDMRITDPVDNEHTNVIVRRTLIDKLGQEKPAALLISGDIPYRGASDDDWAQVDKELKPLWDAKFRIYPALGNHELYGEEGHALQNWWKRFRDLNGKRWYSVLFGNCEFIVLDSDSH